MRRYAAVMLCFGGGLSPAGVSAQDATPQRPALGFYGTPGHVEMPSARALPDATIGISVTNFSGFHRNSITFQALPRLSTTLRYSKLNDLIGPGEALFDRSVDLQYLLLDEGRYRPALAIGLRDIGGTGALASEYLVASKAFGDRIDVSVGLGWGRLGTNNSFRNPLSVFGSAFDNRGSFSGRGGEFSIDQWFRGPAAVFAGVNWQATDKLTLSAEYSSDAYVQETSLGLIDINTPVSFSAQYRLNDSVTLGAAYLYGATVGVSASFVLNPRNPPNGGSLLGAPPPVLVRSADLTSWDPGAVVSDADSDALRLTLAQELGKVGLVLDGLAIEGAVARVQLRNPTYDVEPQVIGRTARILTRVMPAHVETFEIVPTVQGLRTARVALQRADLERLEHAPDGAALSYAAARIEDAASPFATTPIRVLPRFSWGVSPFVATSLFDPDKPLRIDGGLEVSARYELADRLFLSGAAQIKLIGNIGSSARIGNSALPNVRTNGPLYSREGGTGISHLTLDYFSRPGRNLYGRVTVGYLESMFGGASAELLWKPVDSRLALGVEVNYARQRDFDRLFGFQDYSVATGHVSAYYAFRNGFEGSVDVGRYLAGDVGATVTLARSFGNGWKVGAFVTKTNVSAADFGEGSFDKGVTFSVPLSWILGQPSQRSFDTALRPIQRDGGARLSVQNRLYGLVSEYHDPALATEWGQFWK